MEEEVIELINAAEQDRNAILKSYNEFIAKQRYPNDFTYNTTKTLLDEILIYAIVPSMINFYTSGRDIVISLKMYGTEARLTFSHKQCLEIDFESYKPPYTEHRKYSKYEFEIFKNYVMQMISSNLIQAEHFLRKAKSYVFLKRDTTAADTLENYINLLSKQATIVGYKDKKYDRTEYLNRFSKELCKYYKTYAIFKTERKAGFFMVGIDDKFRNPSLEKDEVTFQFYKLRDNIEWPNNYTKKEAVKIKSTNDLQTVIDWFNN